MVQTGAVTLPEIDVDLDREAVLDAPPFSRWTVSHSGDAVEACVDRLLDPLRRQVVLDGLYAIRPAETTAQTWKAPPEDLLAGTHVGLGVLSLRAAGPTAPQSKLDPLVWDALENVALQEARTTLLDELLDAADREGFNTTRVHAPGTRPDGWELSARQVVFEALPIDQIGVTVREGVPDPPKTLSFAMGLGPDLEQATVLLTCADCEKATYCPYAGGAERR